MTGRVALVASCRTPFAKSGEAFKDLSALDLAKVAVRELIERSEVDPKLIGTLVMGQVVPSIKAPNLGRETALGVLLPKSVPAHTINRACASADSGHRGRGFVDPDGPYRGGNRGRRGVAFLRAHSPLEGHDRSPDRRVQGPLARRAPPCFQSRAPQGPHSRYARHCRTFHRAVHGPVGRADGEGQRHLPRRAGRDRVSLSPERREGARRWEARSRDRRGSCSAEVRDYGDHGRPDPRGHHDGRSGQVEAGIRPPIRLGDGGERLASHRWRGRGSADVRGPREGARLRPPRLHQVLGGGRRRSRLAVADGPGPRHPDGSRSRRTYPCGHGPHRDARGLRRAGGFEYPGPGERDLRSGASGPEFAGGDGRSLASERMRQLDRDRPPFGATGARIAGTLGHEMSRRHSKFGLISVCAQGGMGFAMVLER